MQMVVKNAAAAASLSVIPDINKMKKKKKRFATNSFNSFDSYCHNSGTRIMFAFSFIYFLCSGNRQ